MDEGNTLVNALIGAAVSVIGGAVVPFAPLLGGALAGYLEGGDRSDGLRVGLVSGLIALVPTLLVGALAFALFGFLAVGSGRAGFGVFGLAFVLLALALGALYVVGLSVAGGWVGNYVKYDTDVEV